MLKWTLPSVDVITNHNVLLSGILIVVSIGVALGVFFGGLMLFAINLYMRR